MEDSAVSVPAVVARKRRVWIIASISVLVLLLIVIATVTLLILRRTAPAGSSVAKNQNSSSGTNTTTPSSSTVPNTSVQANNLAVTVSYKQAATFSLSIADVERTWEASNLDSYTPATGAPYSLLRVLDAAGKLILEQPFGVATTATMEDASNSVPLTVTLPESTAYLIIALKPGDIPAQVQVMSVAGGIFDQRSFVFNELKVPQVPLSVSPTASPKP